MALTGIPLLVLCWAATKLVIGLAMVGWRHGGRLRLLTRALSIVLCEAVGLATLGVAANRALDLYPSWAALLHAVPRPVSVAAPPGRLDGWLHSRDVHDSGRGVTFTWQPPGWSGWGLAEAPRVFVPQAYFSGASLHFPVIVVAVPPVAGLAAAGGRVSSPAALASPWNDQRVLAAAAGSAQAVVVLLRISRTTTAGAAGVGGTVTERLPYALNEDLRVSSHGWAVIGIGTDAPLGPTVLAEQPERYQDAALVADGGAAMPVPVLAQLRHASGQQPLCLVAASRGAVPPAVRVLLVPAPSARLAAALAWVYALLPAPLDPPETGPIGVPPKPRPRPRESLAPSTPPTAAANSKRPAQPRPAVGQPRQASPRGSF